MIGNSDRNAPALDVIVTLCVFAASLFKNAILKARPAGTLRVAGENVESFASSARISGAGVGRGVGLGVGLGVGAGVGLGVGVGFGMGDTAGFGVGVGESVSTGVGVGSMLTLGSACEVADGVELTGVLDPVGDAAADAVGAAVASLGTAATGDAGVAGLEADPPQAATSRPAAISPGSRVRSTAAL